jgi:hypothetical protein
LYSNASLEWLCNVNGAQEQLGQQDEHPCSHAHLPHDEVVPPQWMTSELVADADADVDDAADDDDEAVVKQRRTSPFLLGLTKSQCQTSIDAAGQYSLLDTRLQQNILYYI